MCICIDERPGSVAFSFRSSILGTEWVCGDGWVGGNEMFGKFSLSYVSMFASEFGSCRMVVVGNSLTFFGRQTLSVPKANLISAIIRRIGTMYAHGRSPFPPMTWPQSLPL